ncbi:hypothetical protein [Micromonospora sp. U21]|uniref:hypothetical protein n=1 Tax=Micromonospora sp. U21 TaxID=2824899 RepID=UPI001B36CBB1|nr:hypothetical protein [Micromonospora sp. U21]MBQ0903087.1 hypothetical protein [Micromonospora sp. U21]
MIAGCSQARTGTFRRADGPGDTGGVDAAGVEDPVGAVGDVIGAPLLSVLDVVNNLNEG